MDELETDVMSEIEEMMKSCPANNKLLGCSVLKDRLCNEIADCPFLYWIDQASKLIITHSKNNQS